MKRVGARTDRGSTLVSVLIALVVAGVGALPLVRLVATETAAATQNQTASSIAALGNGFWGVVQANPSLLGSSSLSGSYSSSNYTSAPGALQPWLAQAVNALPAGQVAIATSADAGSGVACAATTGCTVTLTLQWGQVGTTGIAASTRSQVLYFQFGL